MQLSATTTVVLAPAATTTTNNVNINFMNDNLSSVSCQVSYDDGTIQNLTLWNASSNPTYTAIGNWTQEMANERVIYLVQGGAF